MVEGLTPGECKGLEERKKKKAAEKSVFMEEQGSTMSWTPTEKHCLQMRGGEPKRIP